VALPANIGGARRAITLRHAASSVAPIVTTIGTPCVLAWLGARTPGIHRCHQENH
jgi:hypothetical protein